MQKDYAVIQKVIHWLMGIFIMLDLFIAQKFGNFIGDEIGFTNFYNETRFASRVDHATLGYILTILFVLRVYFRQRLGGAELPKNMPKWQIYAASIGHAGLYFLMFGLFFNCQASGARVKKLILV